jgi:hypothetical protein
MVTTKFYFDEIRVARLENGFFEIFQVNNHEKSEQLNKINKLFSPY